MIKKYDVMNLLVKEVKCGEYIRSIEIIKKSKDSGIDLVSTCLVSGVIDDCINLGLLQRIGAGTLKRTDISDTEWIKLVQELKIKRSFKNGLYINSISDKICDDIINILKEYKNANAAMIKERIKGISQYELTSRLKKLKEDGVIEFVGEHSANRFYKLKTITKSYDEQIAILKNEIIILKAAFISISKKLQQGQNINTIMIETGKMIEEMI